MKLIIFRYGEVGWKLDLTQFSDQILLVGQNASGKSKTIRSLAKVAAIISQKTTFSAKESMDALLAYSFQDNVLVYHFQCLEGLVISESLTLEDNNGNELESIIKRNSNDCILRGETINPPINKLVTNVRRDTQLYPMMEMLQAWADNVLGFSFNETDMFGDSRTSSWYYGYEHAFNSIISDLEHTTGAKEEYLERLKDINYNITDIKAFDFGTEKKVMVKEQGINRPIFDVNMSKGMFRALFVVAYLIYFKRHQQGQPAMLLIDDLCEGLDYERSTKLGKLCFEMCEQLGIQLMASSNDSFLMDVVDLKYWNILHRNNNKVEVINKEQHPDMFDRFEMTGLNNFDLFSSDFIARHINRPKK